MALSFCSDLGTQLHHPELTAFLESHSELMAMELLGCPDNILGFSDTYLNPSACFEALEEPPFYSDSITNLLPCFSTPYSDDVATLSSEFFPLDEEPELCQFLKRQKVFENIPWQSNFVLDSYNGYVPHCNPLVPEVPEPVLPKLEASLPAVFSSGVRNESSTSSVKKPSGGSLSAQSIAARERRRKITEKTQELGKLIPGGNKMNTAEMFQSASKYVKFLQAQVQLLELMGSVQEKQGCPLMHTPELRNLLSSSTIQEKLYSEDKCLVPTEFVQTIANHEGIQSKPFIVEEIVQLLETHK